MATSLQLRGFSGLLHHVRSDGRVVRIEEPLVKNGEVSRFTQLTAQITPRRWEMRDPKVRWKLIGEDLGFAPPENTWSTFVLAVREAYGIQIPDECRPAWLEPR